MAQQMEVVIDGKSIFIETEKAYGYEETSSLDKVADKAQEAFEQAKTTIVSVAKGVVDAVYRIDQAITPDEFQLEFAIKFNAEGQAVLSKASAEANLKVTMTYKHKPGATDRADPGS